MPPDVVEISDLLLNDKNSFFRFDWEKIILKEERTEKKLKETVKCVYAALKHTENYISDEYDFIDKLLPEKITFITSQELEDRYPDLTPKQREYEAAKEYGAYFLMQIGGVLKSGNIHDGRAPDYDDWTLNGDIIFWNELLGIAFEISSMGIRVDPAAMDRQLTAANCDHRRELPFHKMLLADQLPLTIGGGIGQSRLCMLLIGCAHIGEVQTSLWDADTLRICAENNIPLL